MGMFEHNDEHKNNYDEVQNAGHKAKLSHQVIAGAVGYEAAKAYNEHCKKSGKPNSHEKAMEIFAGLAGVAIDRLAETKGHDFLDKQKAKHEAEKIAKAHFDNVF
ncbi:hypothetical protein APHAL10511_002221 [Amanita phalloides]|nr:hypothetical protein APHAL10511_002221 [Amanita phalloides]